MNNSPVSVYMSAPCDIFLCFFLLSDFKCLDHPGHSVTPRTGRLRPKVRSLTLLYTIFDKIQWNLSSLLGDTSIQVAPPFRRHKTWSRKNVQIISVFVTCILGHENWVSPPFRGHLGNQKVTDHKNRA